MRKHYLYSALVCALGAISLCFNIDQAIGKKPAAEKKAPLLLLLRLGNSFHTCCRNSINVLIEARFIDPLIALITQCGNKDISIIGPFHLKTKLTRRVLNTTVLFLLLLTAAWTLSFRCEKPALLRESRDGFIDKNGELTLPPVQIAGLNNFRAVGFFRNSFAIITNDCATTFINERMEPFPDTYVRCKDFSDGLAAVMLYLKPENYPEVTRLWGFIDTTGKMKITPRFADVEPFSCGLAAARPFPATGQSLWGFIDSSGNWVIKPVYDEVLPFSEGLAVVYKCGKPSYISPTGKSLISFNCNQYPHSFKCGLAAVLNGSQNKISYINHAGKVVFTKPRFSKEQGALFPSLGAVQTDLMSSLQSDDLKANTYDFSEGLVCSSSSGKWGYLDSAGKTVIQPTYDFVFPFSEGYAVVCNKIESKIKFAYIDRTGNQITPFEFDYATPFSCGLACVYTEKQGYFFINTNGKIAFEKSFLRAHPFSENKALVNNGTQYSDL